MLSFCRETHLRQQRAVPDAAEHTSQLAFTSSSQHSGSSRRPRVIKRRARNRVVIVTTASLSIGKNDDIYTRKNDAVPRLKASRAQKQFHHRGDRRDRHSEARVRERRRTGGRRGGSPYVLSRGTLPARVNSAPRRGDSGGRGTLSTKSHSRADLASGCVYPQAHSVLTGLSCSFVAQVAPVERAADSSGIQADTLRGPVDATHRVSPQLAYVRCHI